MRRLRSLFAALAILVGGPAACAQDADPTKLIRLIVPFALVAALIACALVPQPFYRAALFLQLAFYALSLAGMARMKLGPVARASDAAFTFVVLNTAAVVAFANFVTGRKVAWTR